MEIDLAQMGAVLVTFRMSLDAATRIVQTDRGEVEILIWIARRLGELARRQGLPVGP